MIFKLINKFKFLAYRIVFPFLFKCVYLLVPKKKKTLLLIKADGIGDYILFRNFLTFIRESKKYQDHKIYLLANESQRDLAVALDNESVDAFYWYSDGYFLKFKLVKLLFTLQNLRIYTVIYCNSSRKFTMDWLVNNISADIKIGVESDFVNVNLHLKSITDLYYDHLYKLENDRWHEFEKNKRLAELITEQKCDYIKPEIRKDKLNVVANDLIIIFPGGSIKEKKWPTDNYIALCKLLLSISNHQIAIAGGEGDVDESNEIINKVGGERITNYTGQMNLIQLCQLIAGSRFLISNDTVAIHIAVALDISAFCIARGDHIGRFIPYPTYMYNKLMCAFPSEIADKVNNGSYEYAHSSATINDIKPNDIFKDIVAFDHKYSVL